ncbi:MAG: hypothetical protein OXG98_13535 [Gemmatimonadetes bacterium]|nr:hypothetical protein [Gemmatimonadota bacterium]
MTNTVPFAELSEQLKGNDLPDILVRDHIGRMAPAYFERYEPEVIRRHIGMISRLGPDNAAEVDVEPLDDSTWRLTVVAFDYLSVISILSGLLASNGLSIRRGDVFTYADAEPAGDPGKRSSRLQRRRRVRSGTPAAPPGITSSSLRSRRKIVDVFRVHAPSEEPPDWPAITLEIKDAMRRLRMDSAGALQRRINERVVDYLRREQEAETSSMFPVHVTIDNDTGSGATRLGITGQDTPAFLYALSTALALRNINIRRIDIAAAGVQVQDTLEVTDRRGAKITDPRKLQELRFVIALIKQFTHLLTRAPNPAQALEHFNQLIDQVLANVRPGRAMEEMFDQLEKQEVIAAMAKLFGTSDFLWKDFLRMQYKNLFPVLQDIKVVGIVRSREQMEGELGARLSRVGSYARRKELLNRYKDKEMLRISMREILEQHEDIQAFSRELTTLAEVILESAYDICDREQRRQYGAPLLPSGAPCVFSICALGKCGGRELGWASDMELLFVYAGQGSTSGPQTVLNSEYYERLVRMICGTIESRREGLFEIDLRLRPYGEKGALASSLEKFNAYFNEKGGALPYERHALIKLRAIGGDPVLGANVEAARDAFVYADAPVDGRSWTHLRERQNDELVETGAINVKYSYGGLIDIEYFVQDLQIRYGVGNSAVRGPTTLEAMEALNGAGYLSDEEHDMLGTAYRFLVRLINALRMVRGNARDLVLPDKTSQEFLFLARRLGYEEGNGTGPGEQLWRDIERNMEWAARALRTRFVHKLFD